MVVHPIKALIIALKLDRVPGRSPVHIPFIIYFHTTIIVIRIIHC